MNKKYEIDMTDGPMLRKMIVFAVPLMLSGCLQLLFNTVDVIVVGRCVGDTALAAVGATGALTNLIIGLFMGLSVGTNVLCAQGFGAGRARDVKDTVHTSVLISLLFGAALAVFGYIFSRTFLIWMDTPEDVLDQAALYLKIYFLGMPVIMLYNFASAVLRAIGDTRRPLYFLLIAGVINVILNLFFVLVLHIGVAGVAIATVISQAVSAFLVVRCLIRSDGMIHLDILHLYIQPKTLLRIVSIGLPAGVQGVVFSISNVMIQSSINSFGSYAIAGNTAASNLEGFNGTAMNAFHQTNINFTSQNYGARKYDRIWRCLFLCLIMSAVVGVTMGQGMYWFGDSLLRLYTTDPKTIEFGRIRFLYCARWQFFGGMMDCAVGSLRGIGMSLLPMIVSITAVCGFRVLWLTTVFPQHKTLGTVYVTYPITWTLALIAHVICFVIAFDRIRKRDTERIRMANAPNNK